VFARARRHAEQLGARGLEPLPRPRIECNSCSGLQGHGTGAGQLPGALAAARAPAGGTHWPAATSSGKQQFRHLSSESGTARQHRRGRRALRGSPAAQQPSPAIGATASNHGPAKDSVAPQRSFPESSPSTTKAHHPSKGAAVHALKPLPVSRIEQSWISTPGPPLQADRQG